jgi:hypothetical protein
MAKQSTQKLTRAQIREGLDTIPIDTLLSSGQGKQPKLTAKMKNFAHAVALGQTKASAYRGSYKATATKRTMASKPYELAKDGRIQREILAVQAALDAEKYRTPAQLKALLVQQLVQHSLDDDFPPASRVQCLKLLGQLYEVGAWVERKEITTVSRSEDIRTRLLSRLQTITIDADIVADDALDLLAEIKQGRPDPATAAETQPPASDGHPADPTAGAPPDSGPPRTGEPSHTIPLKQSQPKQGHPSTLTESEIVDDFDK